MSTSVQSITAALRAASVPLYRARTGRTPEQPGVKVRGHQGLSRDGRGVVCVHCEQAEGDARSEAERVGAALTGRGFAVTFDPEYGAVTGVVFVRGGATL